MKHQIHVVERKNEMKRSFDIDETLDDTGTPTYTARRSEDFDNEGIPIPDSFVGHGESELYALIALLEAFASANEEILYDYHGRNKKHSIKS
jgi:beta-phosphoglucomutase-like phosphatase (HAD superfamily)